LSPTQQAVLVSAVRIVDAEPTIDELGKRIVRHVRAAASLEHAERIGGELEQWWQGRVIKHLLNRSQDAIAFQEVHQAIRKIAANYGTATLPVLHQHDQLSDDAHHTFENRQFVRQLLAIGCNEGLIGSAIRDYYRAYAERSGWIQKYLMWDEELDKYETRLVEAWKEKFYTLENDFTQEHAVSLDDYNDVMCGRFGYQLYKGVMSRDIPIRSEVNAEFIMKGSYHILADNSTNLVVKWHPKFSVCETN
jgi:hypothetical protein